MFIASKIVWSTSKQHMVKKFEKIGCGSNIKSDETFLEYSKYRKYITIFFPIFVHICICIY